MEVEVAADVALELATKHDIEALREELRRPYHEGVMAAYSAVVSGGVASFRVFDVPDGMKFDLRKVIAWGDSHNPSTGGVYTNAAAWCALFHGQPGAANIAEFWPYPEASNGQVLPYTREYAKGILQWKAPDNVWFYGTGLTNGENVTCFVFGELMESRRNAVRKR